MILKKHWNMNSGKNKILTKEKSSLSMIEIDMLKLRAGESVRYTKLNTEYGIVILGGKCTVTADMFCYENIGSRINVFDGPATAVYIPKDTAFTVTAVSEAAVAVCMSPAEKNFEAKLIEPDNVIIKDLGKPGWQRQAHFIIDERVEANLLYIGEAYVKSGNWASYPPHKHDVDNMPSEAILEEVYYYEYDNPSGFGIQKVYSKEGDIDETYTVETGDLVEIPKGYHPYACAPGYNAYYLWVMAGKNRGFYMTTDERHKGLVK